MELATLRQMLRHLQEFWSLYELSGKSTLIDPNGYEWSVFDLQYLYDCRVHLSRRQKQAIELCFYHNLKERDAARMMGISANNPVSVYANNGLKKILQMVDSDELRRFRAEGREPSIPVMEVVAA